VELLAVITIIVLLIAMLVPALTSARELARRAKCLEQYSQIGTALHGFAASHLERGPGRAYVCQSPDRSTWNFQDASTVNDSYALGWKSMLEVEYFQTQPNGIPRFPCWLPMTYTPNNGVGYSSDVQTRRQQLACPSARVSLQNYCYREMCVSDDFEGGLWPNGFSGWDTVAPAEGPYGLRVETPPPLPPGHPVYPGWPSMQGPNASWSIYTLGPRFAAFPNPGGQFAVWEADEASDETNQYTGSPANDLTVNDVGQWIGKPWVGHGGYNGDVAYGQYAFRHTLPADLSMVKTKATAVFLFIDGHVEALGPNDRIMGNDRYLYKLN
jgi:type II secretory pathway pseudopilin PulG